MVDQLDGETRPSPSAPACPRRWGLAVTSATCTALVIVFHRSAGTVLLVALMLVAGVASIELARRESRSPGDVGPIAATIAALYALAVAVPPRFTFDVGSYTMIGRIAAVHRMNPYRVAPADVHDPLRSLLPDTWSSGTTPYSPLWVGYTSVVSFVSGPHPLVSRLLFQLTAAAAIGVALWLIWRVTRSTAAIAMLGLNPAVAAAVVNGGHNDAVLALGLLAIVLLLARGRTLAAGCVLCGVVLVKITVGFVALPLLIWTLTRHGPRGVVRLLAPSVLFAVPLCLVIPNAVDSMLGPNVGVVTRVTIVNLPMREHWLHLTGHDGHTYVVAGVALALAISMFAAVIGRRQPDAGRACSVGAAGWLLGAAYVLAPYAVLGLVVGVLRPRDRIALWLAAEGTLLAAVFRIPQDKINAFPGSGHVITFWLPVALAAGFVWAVIPLVRDARRLSREARGALVSRTSPTPTA